MYFLIPTLATNHMCRIICADSYMYLPQARIQEFLSGGVQLPENFDKQKKNGGGCFFPFSLEKYDLNTLFRHCFCKKVYFR